MKVLPQELLITIRP